MWSFSSRKNSRQAVFVFDGQAWYGRIFAKKRRGWICIESISHLSHDSWEIPNELLSCAVSNSAKRVRILLPSEIYNIQVSLPADIEPEEVHTALAYEVASEVGIDAHMVRLAAVRSSQFWMGGHDKSLLAGSFEIDQLTRFEETCKNNRLIFDGVGSVELGTLNCHARRQPNARLLLLRANSGFYVTPKTEMLPFSSHSIPFGVEPFQEPGRDSERFERAANQFKHSRTHVHIWCTQMPSEDRKEQLKAAFGSDVALEYVDFANEVTRIATHAAWQGHVGQVTCGCAMVSMCRTSKSPYRAGTWMLLIILAITAAYIGLRFYTFQEELKNASKRDTAWKELEQQRKRLDSEVKRLRNFQKECASMENLMKKPVLPKGLLAILETLANNIPPYTQITSIEEISENKYKVSGTTQYQEGLIKLNQAMTEEMRKYKLFVEPGQVKQSENGLRQEKLFSLSISPEGGNS